MITSLIAFIVGLFIGACVGLFSIAICVASKEDEDENS